MEYVSLNGQLIKADLPVLHAGNRSFRYGDGIFETMRVSAGQILLRDLHFGRLTRSLQVLKIDYPADFTNQLSVAVSVLSAKNGAGPCSKLRLAIYREADNRAGFLVEQSLLPSDFYEWNREGWSLDLYEDARKSNDVFANLKSANYLPYSMAQLHATANGFDECLVVNGRGTIADGARTNVFIVRQNEVLTPPLSAGCVDGVMRRFLISALQKRGGVVRETELEVSAIETADEVFLTNAVQGVRWVNGFRSKSFRNAFSRTVFEELAVLRPPGFIPNHVAE